MGCYAALGGALQFVALSAYAQIIPTTYTAPLAFPTSIYSSFHYNPTATSVQPQPVVSDPVTHLTYNLSLTDPDAIPVENTIDTQPLPSPVTPSASYSQAFFDFNSRIAKPVVENDCVGCLSLLKAFKTVISEVPEQGPQLAIILCKHYNLSTNCTVSHGRAGLGSVYTQVLFYADVEGYDGRAFCANLLRQCPDPGIPLFDYKDWFSKPKPDPLPMIKPRSGQRLKVLHVSDLHLDPRYATASEANCTSPSPCCRKNSFNQNSRNMTVVPAPQFGSFNCDTPISLTLAALQSIPPLTGTQDNGFSWTIYTGDLVSHDNDAQLSRDYVMYTETVVYDLFKRMLGSGPVYSVLGNHDTYLTAQDAPHFLGGDLGQQFSWNYDHVASLWGHEEWLPDAAVQLARSYYGSYSVQRADGLRIISLNSDFWYRSNVFNYINMTNPDPSGVLRFLTDELQDSEVKGDRVWIIAHILTGWDGSNALLTSSDLFYHIVDRFSPHVISNIFFGHTHEDHFFIMYQNNATVINESTAQTVSWIGPSLTPITNLNSGFRVYEVDSATFEIMDAHTWISDVNTYSELDVEAIGGPVYSYEYSTRTAYGGNITTWSEDDPLNATWWHLVTEAFENDENLFKIFNKFQGKGSVRTPTCTGACMQARICYMRSGSSSISQSKCQPGFGSVQW